MTNENATSPREPGNAECGMRKQRREARGGGREGRVSGFQFQFAGCGTKDRPHPGPLHEPGNIEGIVDGRLGERMGVPFPLTPALSLGERENGPPGFGMGGQAVVQGFNARIFRGILSPNFVGGEGEKRGSVKLRCMVTSKAVCACQSGPAGLKCGGSQSGHI